MDQRSTNIKILIKCQFGQQRMHRFQMTGTRTRLEGSGKGEAVGSKVGRSHELPKAMESFRLEVVGDERGDEAVESDCVLVGRLREGED